MPEDDIKKLVDMQGFSAVAMDFCEEGDIPEVKIRPLSKSITALGCGQGYFRYHDSRKERR